MSISMVVMMAVLKVVTVAVMTELGSTCPSLPSRFLHNGRLIAISMPVTIEVMMRLYTMAATMEFIFSISCFHIFVSYFVCNGRDDGNDYGTYGFHIQLCLFTSSFSVQFP